MRVVVGTVLGNYTGIRAIHQENAIRSWRAIDEVTDIRVFHWGPMHEDLIAKYQLSPVLGLPTFRGEGRYQSISSIVQNLVHCAAGGVAILVNSDIILRPSLLVRLTESKLGDEWVAVSRRWDVEVPGVVIGSIEEFCRRSLGAGATLHDAGGIDFFSFHTKQAPAFPDIYVGAAGWDNIAMFSLRQQGLPVLDVTALAGVFHQQHSPRRSADGRREAYAGEEAGHHAKIMPDRRKLFTVSSATHVITSEQRYSAWQIPAYAQRRCIDHALMNDWPAPMLLAARIAGAAARIGITCWRQVLPSSSELRPYIDTVHRSHESKL